jgi:hypothetical protein
MFLSPKITRARARLKPGTCLMLIREIKDLTGASADHDAFSKASI